MITCLLFVILPALPLLMVIIGFAKLGKKVFYHLEKIDKINQEIMEGYYKNHSYDLQTLHRELKVELLHLEAMIIQIPKKDREKTKPRKRTAEQKKVQSDKRKEWWKKKRREQVQIAPDGMGVIQPQNWKELLSEPAPSNKSP